VSVAWHVLDGYLTFVEDKTEWTGTDITFDIAAKDAALLAAGALAG
jgi:hypothetical protein